LWNRISGVTACPPEFHAMRFMAWIEQFTQDLWFSFRLLRKRPWSFLSAVAALTLGIGLVTFSLCAMNCVFFGKLPFPDYHRLVYATIPELDLREFQEQQSTFEALSAFRSGSANFKAIDAPSRRRACFISANFLTVLRAAPVLGRGFLPTEDQLGSDQVALLGYDLWEQEFHGSPAAIGSIIHLDGQPRTVIGIMPKGFKFPIDDEIWIPSRPGSSQSSGWGYVFGRLKTTATAADARTELNLIAARLDRSRTGQSSPNRLPPILVGPFTRYLPDTKGSHGPAPGVVALIVVTSLVLIIACANVAGLTLANAVQRGTELAVRGALGATRARLISQMLIESLILAMGGAGGGLLTIACLTRWFGGWFASNQGDFSNVPFWMRIEIDGRLLISLVGIIFITNLLAGLWPALQATKRDVNEMLKSGSGCASGPRAGRLPWLLAVVQIAFSLVVLAQTFVLLSFSRRLTETHLPFDPATMLTARVDLPPTADAGSFYNQIERDLAGLPGLQSVALSNSDPASGHRWSQLTVEGRDTGQPEDRPFVGAEVVSAGFFQALSLPLLQGRGFNAADAVGSQPVAIVNSTFARMYLPPGNPLGHRFREGTNEWLTIVGCVPDLEYDPAAESHEPIYFLPARQAPVSSMVIMLRGNGRSTDWTKALRTEVARLQPDLAIYRVATIQTLIDHQTVGYYLASLLLGTCGAGSLFLATLGIFGLIALSVNQRTREIGVRVALGATQRRVITTLLSQAASQITAGLALGLLLAVALDLVLTHAIAGYPTVNYPSLVFLATVGFLGAVSFIAVLIPAVRGARVDPMVALRFE
jgi:predicted permease